MGELVRHLRQAIDATPPSAGFFTTFAGEDIRDRIAAHLDDALFESVLSAELRALGTCGAFDRLFDLLSQFVSRVTTYRWMAVTTRDPVRFGLHTNPRDRAATEQEARTALDLAPDVRAILVEDDDAFHAPPCSPPLIKPIELGGIHIGNLAISLPELDTDHEDSFASIVAREVAGPIRMATLVEESQRLATIDVLTGLMNRRAFTDTLIRELARCARYGLDLSLLLLDVDHFKSINDRFGHGTGDTVLAALGDCMQAAIRGSDIAGRWGGEEFVILLPCTPRDGAHCFAERLRSRIEGLDVLHSDGTRVPITASIGVTPYVAGDTPESLVERADQAMYAAKSGGRNRVVVADAPSPNTPTDESVLVS
jgi:diguanylate cyclase (GGDEF)-like protein